MATYAVNSSNVKLRFSEPYYSQATNIQAGISLPGAYRGGDVLESSGGADEAFRIAVGSEGDTLILHQNTTNGAATVVRLESEVLMDMSGETWPAPSDISWYVYLTVDYQLDQATTASIETGTSLPTDAVSLAVIDIEAGDTSIEQSSIRTDGTARAKVLSKKGILVNRYEEIPASVGTTRFQINGRVCWLNDDFPEDGKMKLIRDASNYRLFGSDGGSIYTGDWYNVPSGGVALTVSDMDEDGCYTNPYIEMDFTYTSDTDYDDAFKVIYWTHAAFDEIDTDSDNQPGYTGVSDRDVFCEEQSGTPDSLSSAPLYSQIFALLSITNRRIRNSWPTANTSTWENVWRSNNIGIGVDSSVDNETTSLYVNDTGVLLCKGGYISSTNMVMNEGGDISCIIFSDTAVYRMGTESFSSGSYPASNSLFSSSDWGSWELSDATGAIFNDREWSNIFYGLLSADVQAVPGSGGYDSTAEILKLADHTRVYYRSISEHSELIISSGCYWYESGTEWRRVTTEAQNASMMSIGRDGIKMYQKYMNDADFATGWTDSDWSTSWQFGANTTDDFYPLGLDGLSKDEFVASFSTQKSDAIVRNASSILSSGAFVSVYIPFRGRMNTPPSPGDFASLKKSGQDMANLTVSGVSEFGFNVSGYMEIESGLESYAISSITTPDTIVIAGTSNNFFPGQGIYVKNASFSEYYQIVTVVKAGTTTLTVVGTEDLETYTDHALYAVDLLSQGNQLGSEYYIRLNW